MDGFLIAMLVLPLTGVMAWCARGNAYRATWIGMIGNVLAIAFALPAAIQVLYTAQIEPALKIPYSLFGEGLISFQLDPLSAFFAIPVLIVPALCAMFGIEASQRFNQRGSAGEIVFWTNCLVAGMLLVLIARHGLSFLLAWELIGWLAFALIQRGLPAGSLARGGWLFLLYSHLSFGFLVVMFFVWKYWTGDFSLIDPAAKLQFAVGQESWIGEYGPSIVFSLALMGFGTIANLFPLHFWSKQTYQHLPGNISAVLVSALSTLGIYGVLRMLAVLGPQDTNWNLQWGAGLIFFGIFTAIRSALKSVAQNNLVMLLTHSSSQQMGIIILGIGMGLLGRSLPQTVDGESTGSVVALLGFGGALLHVLNLALTMTLLFLGSQAVMHATETTELSRLGGLAKRLRWTSALFFIGGVAVCGLPPLNGFASMFLLYYGAVQEEVHATQLDAVPALTIMGGLALMAGLSAVAYTKSIGYGFLGQAHSRRAWEAREVGWFMRLPMFLAALGCVAIGLFAPRIAFLLQPVLQMLTIPTPQLHLAAYLREAFVTLEALVLLNGSLVVLSLVMLAFRWRLLLNREINSSITWGGGHSVDQADINLESTVFSFAEPVTGLFNVVPMSNSNLPENVANETQSAGSAKRTSPAVSSDSVTQRSYLFYAVLIILTLLIVYVIGWWS